MKIGTKSALSLSIAISLCIIHMIFFSSYAFSEEYKFDRMWPELEQAWYFNSPEDIAIDENGNIYISDSGNQRIQKFTKEGALMKESWKTLLNDGSVVTPKKIAVNQMNEIYVTVSWTNNILKYSSDGTKIKQWGKTGSFKSEFDQINGIDVDKNGDVYVGDVGNNRIQKFDSDGNFLKMWGVPGTGESQFDGPCGIAIDENENVYVADYGNRRIQIFNTEGEFLSQWKKDSVRKFSGLRGLCADKKGHIYVSAGDTVTIQKFNTDGSHVKDWGSYGIEDGQLGWHFRLAADMDGNIYSVDWNNSRVQKFDSDGEFLSIWDSKGSENGEFRLPKGIALDKDGNVYVVDADNARIQKFDSDGNFITKWGEHGSENGRFLSPYGIAIDGFGNVYVTEIENHRVQKFDSDGNFKTKWGGQGNDNGKFDQPHGIAVDTSDNVYVVDRKNYRIQKFGPDGNFKTKWGIKDNENGEFDNGEFSDPIGIAVDRSGYVYVTNWAGKFVQKFDSEGNFIQKFDTSGTHGIALDSDGNIYISLDYWSLIHKYTPNGEFIAQIGTESGTDPGMLNGVTGICVSEDGRVYATDTNNNRVQVFEEIGYIPHPHPDGLSKAIIVAGGGPYDGNALWKITDDSATTAYRCLNSRKYYDKDIYYLSANHGIVSAVDADATNDQLKYAITEWSKDTDNLLIYIVDHGGPEKFRMREDEELLASDLDSWLDELQESTSINVTIVYDACQSGSFIPVLTPPEKKIRIIAASSDSNERAWFGADGTLSFGYLFWSRMANGSDFYTSFIHAKNAVKLIYGQNLKLMQMETELEMNFKKMEIKNTLLM